MSSLVVLSGALLTSFFLWLDRGMYVPGSAGLGIILFFLWGLAACGSFLILKDENNWPLPNWIWPLFFGISLVLLLLNTQVMYAGLATSNPVLLNKGPIRVFPNNLAFYLSLSIWLCMGSLAASLITWRSAKESLNWGLCLVSLIAASHLIVLRLVPFPFIDVFTAISEASVALLEVRNPYQISFTDIYQGQGITPSGFGYLPGLFPWAAAGMVLAGDIRVGNFLALLGIALIFLLAPGTKNYPRIFYLSGLLFAGGAGLFVAEQAWIDPILAFLIFASAWLVVREKTGWAAILAGLLCATKQYGVVAFCFLLLMVWNRQGGRLAVKFFSLAFFTGVLVQLPFCLWGFQDYWNAVLIGVGKLPFRPDAYTLLSLANAKGISIRGFPFLGPLVFLGLFFQCRRLRIADPGIIMLAASVSYMAIFLTNRHAFCNYYQLVFLILVCALFFMEFFNDPVSGKQKSK